MFDKERLGSGRIENELQCHQQSSAWVAPVFTTYVGASLFGHRCLLIERPAPPPASQATMPMDSLCADPQPGLSTSSPPKEG